MASTPDRTLQSFFFSSKTLVFREKMSKFFFWASFKLFINLHSPLNEAFPKSFLVLVLYYNNEHSEKLFSLFYVGMRSCQFAYSEIELYCIYRKIENIIRCFLIATCMSPIFSLFLNLNMDSVLRMQFSMKTAVN